MEQKAKIKRTLLKVLSKKDVELYLHKHNMIVFDVPSPLKLPLKQLAKISNGCEDGVINKKQIVEVILKEIEDKLL